jgi:hypothetical protein
MDVDFSKLPIDIRRQIPLSLRSYNNIHIFEELPVTIQYLIKNYFEKILNVKYDVSFDIKPTISKYNDFVSFDNVTDLIVEYLKNYLSIPVGTYPFDPYFGSYLQYQVQTRDVNLRQTLVSTEINNISNNISNDMNANINIDSIEVLPISMGASTEFSTKIVLSINDQRKSINIEFNSSS